MLHCQVAVRGWPCPVVSQPIQSDPLRPPPPTPPPQVVELTAAGRSFFRGVFEAFDRDEDGVLSAREQEEMFSTAPAE